MVEAEKKWAETVASKIARKIGKRKLVVRFKETEVEKILKDKYGIDVAFRVTQAKERADEKTVFMDTVLSKNSSDYFLVISHELAENNNVIQYYKKIGLDENSIFFVTHKPLLLRDVIGAASDEYANSINSASKVNVDFCGYNSSVIVGKNCVVPHLKIGNNTKVVIGDGCILKIASPELASNTEFILGNKVAMYGTNIKINTDSAIEIGANCTIQTGTFRTGRNQRVVFGEDCMFSWDITLLPHDGYLIWDVNSEKVLNNTDGIRRDSIKVGNHVCIGGEAALSYGTNIGDGSIVGFRSFVNKKFPNNVIVAGTPAKVIKKDIAWSRENYTEDESLGYGKIDPFYRRKTEL